MGASNDKRNDCDIYKPFLEGNTLIEEAIAKYRENDNEENTMDVLEAIRTRMHNDGFFITPIAVVNEETGEAVPGILQLDEDESYFAAFTSEEGFKKGPNSDITCETIYDVLKDCLDSDVSGIIINPWGEHFVLVNGFIEMIFEADGDEEYVVPDVEITSELLEDGEFLKKAINICGRNNTELNIYKLLTYLRNSHVWVPYINDYARFIPDILVSDDEFFFPVFTSEAEMGEYGDDALKVRKPFVEAINLARTNENNVKGIIINGFSEAFEVSKEIFDMVESSESFVE